MATAAKKAKTKGTGNKKETELDKIFEETIMYWEELAIDVHHHMYDVVKALRIITDELGEDLSEEQYRIISQARIITIVLEGLEKKTELLSESLSSAGIIKPIDDLESATIGAIRSIRRDAASEREAIKSLSSLFKLAKENNDFSLPQWIKEYIHFDELKEASTRPIT